MAIDASLSGTFAIGGDLVVNRLGFGAMRITGFGPTSGIWDEPDDPAEARRVLARLPELGVNLVDTAESYGPEVSEQLIGEVLAPYSKGTIIATKGGLLRHGPSVWLIFGHPDYLKANILLSLRRLKLDRLDLWQLHRIDETIGREAQFEAIAGFVEEGLIRHVGLSEVSIEEIKAAQEYFPVATVQNRYSPRDRASEAVLDFCEANSIGFMPWAPLGGDDKALTRPSSVTEALTRKYNASPSQLALAWALKRSPVMLPIPGTSKVKHLEENTAAAAIALSDEDFRALSA